MMLIAIGVTVWAFVGVLIYLAYIDHFDMDVDPAALFACAFIGPFTMLAVLYLYLRNMGM